ncbi:uncharacterized protein LOC107490752 [Arachis duranensis]|uniref:Uncharacterized protein LOC107490752 n=1 Tax=Arachis duranensis TaxID=130453 RepID=A0A6P4DMV8_ARADU|nr:uncharacterized protein LOC107490752 [Arachis duranensis]
MKRSISEAFRGSITENKDAEQFLKDNEKFFIKNEKAEASSLFNKLVSMSLSYAPVDTWWVDSAATTHPFPTVSWNRQRYFITFIDNYSRYGYLYLIHENSQVLDVFKSFKVEAELQLGKKIKAVKSNRGGEYYKDTTVQVFVPIIVQDTVIVQEQNENPTVDPVTVQENNENIVVAQDTATTQKIMRIFLNPNLYNKLNNLTKCHYSLRRSNREKKIIYGLKQASRQWYHKFIKSLPYGFEVNIIDEYVYRKFSGSKHIFLVLYVDDILLASNDKGLLHETKKFLSNKFEMKDFGDASFALGIEILRYCSQSILGLSQKNYIEKILSRYGMERCRPMDTLVTKEDKFSIKQCPKNDLERTAMHDKPYA